MTWSPHTRFTPRENWRGVQDSSYFFYMVLLCKTHSKRELKRGTGQFILLFTWSPFTRLTPKENWRGVQDRLSLLLHGPLIQDSLPKRIEEGYRTDCPCYYMVPSYKTHSQRELKRGTGQVILLCTWSPHTSLTPKENWTGVKVRSSFLSHGPLSLQKWIE